MAQDYVTALIGTETEIAVIIVPISQMRKLASRGDIASIHPVKVIRGRGRIFLTQFIDGKTNVFHTVHTDYDKGELTISTRAQKRLCGEDIGAC